MNSIQFRPEYVSILPFLFLIVLPVPAEQDTSKSSNYQFGFGLLGGRYGAWDIDSGRAVSDDCEGIYYPDWDGVERSFNYRGISASIERESDLSDGMQQTAGLRVIFGQSKSPLVDTPRRNLETVNEFMYMVNPYIRMDWRFIGLAAGIHFGSSPTRYLISQVGSRGYRESLQVQFEPMISVRAFPQELVFLEAKYQDADPGSFPLLRLQLGLGVGFRNHGRLGAVKVGLTDWGYYLESEFPVSEKLILNGRFGFAGKNEDLQEPQNHINIGIKVRP